MSKEVVDNIPYVIRNIKKIRKENPCKKTLQKLVYLIEEKGIDLNYTYGLHFYGPYSKSLDEDVAFFETLGILNVNYIGLSHEISVEGNFGMNPDLETEDKEIIHEVIDKFKDHSPSRLELLSTALYAHRYLDDKSEESVLQGVKKIKGDKYPDDQIKKVMHEDFPYFGIKYQENVYDDISLDDIPF